MYGESRTWKSVLGIMIILPLLGLLGMRGVKSIMFDRDCGDHMKRAADANSVEMAIQEMRVVIQYLEDNQMTSGYTSIFYNTPGEDVGYWYNNLKSALAELESEHTQAEATPLERSNLLIKLRETLVTHTSDGEEINVPSGISAFPHNAGYVVGYILFGLLALGGCALIYSGYNDY